MSLRFLGRGLLVVPKSGLVTKRPPKRLAVRAPQLWGSLPENLRQAKMVSSLCLLSKLCFMQKLSYSSCIILTHCSLPFSLFYDGFVSTYCTLLQCFVCHFFKSCFNLFCEPLCNPVSKSAIQIKFIIIIIIIIICYVSLSHC